jgi:hypothetical protein
MGIWGKNMNNKILIGSIIAVAVLIGVSFTSVVGYRSVESDIKVSPLFNIRSSRAIDEESEVLTCEYVGKGEEINIHLSSISKRTEQIQKVIKIIDKMDDKTFSNLVAQIINHLKNQEQMSEKEILDKLQALQHIRENPNGIEYYITKNISIPKTQEYNTCFWYPGCFIIEAIVFIVGFIYYLYYIIFIWTGESINWHPVT